MTRILLVAPGLRPVPGDGWGAIETVVGSYDVELRRRGHQVTVINSRSKSEHLKALRRRPQLVHVHWDPFLKPWSKLARPFKLRVVSTTHDGGMPERLSDSNDPWAACLGLVPEHWALSTRIADSITHRYPNSRVGLLPNSVDVAAHMLHPNGNGRALFLGQWSERKRQAATWDLLESSGVECDFVGPDAPHIAGHRSGGCQYLGEWSTMQVRERLGSYSALVLPSTSEASPLVVLEAQAAGIPVVVSPAASANLTLDAEWVFVASLEMDFVGAVRQAIAGRDELTTRIRHHAERHLGWERAIDEYERLMATPPEEVSR